MAKDSEIIFELLSLVDHCAADATKVAPDEAALGPEWRITYQPDTDGDGVSRIDEIGFVRFFDETGGWL